MPPERSGLLIGEVFAQLGLSVLERGWLSSNNIVFGGAAGTPATVVDTGYDSHSSQTLVLVQGALGGRKLERVVNTHLHSDHCGGNSALQSAWDCEVWVPEVSFDSVNRWDQEALTFRSTGQHCQQFSAQRALQIGESLRLGVYDWDVVGAPGHDPDAVMLFQPESGVLITADALWESRLAIIFPALDDGEAGFAEARATLDVIESLRPSIVIPGHGPVFTGVPQAVGLSRKRLAQFEADPLRHRVHAERALTMFHMLELRRCRREELLQWLLETPSFDRRPGSVAGDSSPRQRASDIVERLIVDGLLRREGEAAIVVA